MEVHVLRLLLTDQDLSQLAAQAARQNDQVSDLQVRVTPQAVVVSGVFHLMMRVNFETFWQVTVREGRVAATFCDLKVVGFSAGLLKGVFLKVLQEEAQKEEALHVEGETIWFDPDRLLFRNGLVGRTNLNTVRLETGSLVIEAGPQA